MKFYLIAQVSSRCLTIIQDRHSGQEGDIYSVASLGSVTALGKVIQ
jgi:hypothetical protein